MTPAEILAHADSPESRLYLYRHDPATFAVKKGEWFRVLGGITGIFAMDIP